MNTLDSLLLEYPYVELKVIGDLYTFDKKKQDMRLNDLKLLEKSMNNELFNDLYNNCDLRKKQITYESNNGKSYKDYGFAAIYDDKQKAIIINHIIRNNMQDFKIFNMRRETYIINYKRAVDYGITEYNCLKQFEIECLGGINGNVLENIIKHEFGHLLGEQYEIYYNSEMIEYFNSLSTEKIKLELSVYASTNINEFVAEGFLESTLSDARPIGIEVRRIMDKVISEKTIS